MLGTVLVLLVECDVHFSCVNVSIPVSYKSGGAKMNTTAAEFIPPVFVSTAGCRRRTHAIG